MSEADQEKPVAMSFRDFRRIGLFVKRKNNMPEEIEDANHADNLKALHRSEKIPQNLPSPRNSS